MQRLGWMQPHLKASVILYVANSENETVTLYDAQSPKASPPTIGVISEGLTRPVALTVDADGNLFVANAAVGSSPANVQMFAPGSRTSAATYTAGITNPVALAVDDRSTLYVANAGGPAPAPLVIGPGVVEFPQGSTTPSTTVSDPNASSLSALTVDRSRNVYVANSSYLCCPVPSIDEFVPHPPQPTVLGIAQSGNGLFRGVTLDASGNLLASDGSQIDIYAPNTQTWPAVSPPTSTFGARGSPAALAFDPSRKRLFVVDDSGNDVIGYDYPSGAIVNLVSKSIESPVAVAVGPSRRPPVRAPQPARPPQPPKPAPGAVYVTTEGGGVASFDTRSLAPGRSLGGGGDQAVALAVDTANNLYVANVAQTENVTVYGPHGRQPLREFAAPFDDYYLVEAVAPDGTVALAEAQPSQVIVFYQGTTTPTIIPMPFFPAGLTFDANSNLYVSIESGGSTVEELPNTGSGFGSPVPLLTGAWFRQIALDGSGNLVVENYNEYPENYTYAVYPPGQTTPTYAIGANLANSLFALDSRSQFLYAIAFRSGGGGDSVWVFRYPTGTPYEYFSIPYANSDYLTVDPAVPPPAPWNGGAFRRHR